MHRWVRGITVGVGGAALVAAAFGAGLSPAGAQDDAESESDAVVWNDQYATVDITTGGEASSGDNVASSFNGNLVVIGQGATADAELLTQSRDEILAWFTSEGFADWMGAGGFIDAGFSVIPGSPVVVPVLGGSATNLITSINNTAAGIAQITAGAAGVSNGTNVTLAQSISGSGADATSDATGGGGGSDADARANNSQSADVGVSSGGSASSGGNRATTANGNAVVIGQGASAGAGAAVDGNSDGGGGGSVTGGTASNEVGSVTNTAQGQASISTGAATVSNNTSVNVTQSNTGSGATSSSTAEGGEAP